MSSINRNTGREAASGAGSIKHRSDGRWEARVCVGYDPETGYPKRISLYGKTQKEVLQKMTEALRDCDKGTYRPPSKLKVAEWMAEWMQTFCANTVRPLTFLSYDTIIRVHINPVIGGMQLEKVKGIDIQRIYNRMTNAGKSGKTVKNVSVVLHKAFQMAIKQGLIYTNPCDAADLPPVVKPEIHPLTEAQIKLFLQEIETSPFRNVFAVTLFAALREGECLGLSWRQIDFEQGSIQVDQQLQRLKKNGEYCIAPYTKSKRLKKIYPPKYTFDFLRDEQARQQANRSRAGDVWSNPDDLVFTNEIGGHLAIHIFTQT